MTAIPETSAYTAFTHGITLEPLIYGVLYLLTRFFISVLIVVSFKTPVPRTVFPVKNLLRMVLTGLLLFAKPFSLMLFLDNALRISVTPNLDGKGEGLMMIIMAYSGMYLGFVCHIIWMNSLARTRGFYCFFGGLVAFGVLKLAGLIWMLRLILMKTMSANWLLPFTCIMATATMIMIAIAPDVIRRLDEAAGVRVLRNGARRSVLMEEGETETDL